MCAGHIQHRFAQFGCAADRFVHGIETGNPSQEDVFSFRLIDGIEHDAAEQERQDEIVELIPIHPVRLRAGLAGADRTRSAARAQRPPDDIECPVLDLDALPILDDEQVIVFVALASSTRPVWFHGHSGWLAGNSATVFNAPGSEAAAPRRARPDICRRSIGCLRRPDDRRLLPHRWACRIRAPVAGGGSGPSPAGVKCHA